MTGENENQAAANSAERRRHKRWKVFEVIELQAASGSAPCVVDDLSETGILVTAELNLEIGEEIGLEFEEFGPIKATVMHLRQTLIGLKFLPDDPFFPHYQAWLEKVAKESDEV